jgi:hypothetical protein
MNPQKHILSKSTFMYGCQCPKRLYLHKFRPELRNPEEEEQSIFSTGTNVGILARDLFHGGINAEPPDTFSYHLSVEQTQKYIKEGATVIYEAAFNFEGVLCAIDILVKEKNKWFAFEVKGTTKIKEQHITDAALQYYVITNSGLQLEDISIIHLNNQYVRRGEIEVQKLFTKESILNLVIEQQEFIQAKIVELKNIIATNEMPVIAVGAQCSKPYECNFTNYCWANIEEESIQKSMRESLINTDYLKEFFSEFKYPFFYFDFETIMSAVPEFNESRPFQQIPFQYSLHIQRTKKSELEHIEFLGDGINDPRELLIKELLKAVGTEGSIIVWNQTFEISRLKELARDFPEFELEIFNVIERIVDLMIPFRKKQYYHPDFNESYSIKKVLPVLVPELSYDGLIIKEGGSASNTYSELKYQAAEIAAEQRVQLLEYCKLDTFAMVKILERINIA